MDLSAEKKREYAKRLMMSRLRLLLNNGFFGLLLMHMTFSLDESCDTAATDGKRIFFNPAFLENLSDPELDFVLTHEILHVVLRHCLRGRSLDPDLFNIACDIVVNSNILLSNGKNPDTIRLRKYGEAMHLTPDGKEGHEYTAEQVYEMLLESGIGPGSGSVKGKKEGEHSDKNQKAADRAGSGNQSGRRQKAAGGSAHWDDHTRWGMQEEDNALWDTWVKRFEEACEAISLRDPSNQRGLLPLFAQRMLRELREPQTDWRTILNNFIQEEIVDYSFAPPDRRFDDSPFFLPDFNEKEDVLKDVLFMIDTSASMSDEMITAAYSEVKGAIDQFNGALKGWLGFFDASVVEPKPFSDEGEFRIIRPVGGGGTDFQIIFEYVTQHMQASLPVSIIILTDGYAPFPNENLAMGIPVLWLLNNEEVTPPWGKTARITV